MKPRHLPWRIALFLLAAVAILAISYTVFSGMNTLTRLDAVEAARDQWQRPAEILQALDLREGHTVVDLGSGAGYFTLKLAPVVGRTGRVLAVDVRRLSLTFLWMRGLLRGQRNVDTIVGDAVDSYVAPQSADAVLICNTYHEFGNPQVVLAQAFRSLRAGGRIVIVDRIPGTPDLRGETHGIAAERVDSDLQRAGFRITARDDRLLQDPEGDPWWLLAAAKSAAPDRP